jgi:DNA-binding response OmpR family regulator
LLRRGASTTSGTAETLCFGDFELRLAQRRLLRGDTEISLTNAEFSLLKILLLNAGRVMSRDDLLAAADSERLPFDRSIDARVARLRKRIEADPTNPRYLRTVWGTGYLFIAQP